MSPKYESDFTQRVIAVIENARLDADISVQELIDRSGIRRSSYFRKMRGETTFTTEDVDSLAKALGLDPFLVLRQASVGGSEDNRMQSDFARAAFEDNDGDGASLEG